MKQCKQITTYAANGKGYTYSKDINITRESDEEYHIESGVINIYPEVEYNELEGFGCAMTETSAYLLSKMEPATRREALKKFFTREGNNIRFVRVSIDSCDYSLEEYQAVPDPVSDPEFKTFSLKRDQLYVLPMLKEALAISEQPLSVLMSPWSPPKQWKTSTDAAKNDARTYGSEEGIGSNDNSASDYIPDRCNGGRLKEEHYTDWARYLAKYVQAYLDEGIPVTMLTLQNESIAATNWDSCVWTAAEQKTFLKDHLYPVFKEAGLAGKIGLYIWDHNKERVYEWARDVIDDETAEMLEGVAFHWYSGDHFEAVKMTAEAYPGMKLMFSECCPLHMPGRIGWGDSNITPETVEYQDAVNYAHDIIGNINAGMNSWLDWNLCVDKDGGPRHVPGGFSATMIANDDGTFRANLIHDYVGHFSRYILPGSKRIGFSRCDDRVDVTAAKNPDGQVVVEVLNRGNDDLYYVIRMNGDIIRFYAPARTISTLLI